MTFSTPSSIVGDVILVLLPWIGRVLFYHQALRRAWNQQPGGAAALLALICCSGRPTPISPPPGLQVARHFLQGRLTPALLQEHLHLSGVPLDSQQLAVVHAINRASTPLVCIHSYAGVGKSVVGHLLIRAFLQAPSTSDRPQIALWVVPTRALREEVLSDFKRQGLAREEQIHWLGRPADTGCSQGDAEEVLQARVFQDQAPARARLAEVQHDLEEAMAACQAEQPRSPAFWRSLATVKATAAKYMSDEVELIVRTFDALLERHVKPLKIVVLTADAAAKVYAGYHHGVMGKLMRSRCDTVLGVIDEGQRADALCGVSLLAHLPSAVVLMDGNQVFPPTRGGWQLQPWSGQLEPEDHEGWQLEHPELERDHSDTGGTEPASPAACHHGSGPGPATPTAPEASSQKNPRHVDFCSLLQQDSGILQLSLSHCKRCGPIICNYLRALFPHFLSDFQAAEAAPPTTLLHIWYHCHWRPTRGYSPKAPVAWEDNLFRAMGAMALQQLLQLESDFQKKGPGQSWDDQAIMVLVACYLNRVAGPLRWYFQELIRAARQLGLLQHTQPTNTQVRIVDTLTGPTSEHTHVLLHRRTCEEADMYKGNQSNEQRYYVAVTRARRSTTVWLDSEPFGTARWPRCVKVKPSHVPGKRFHQNLQGVVWRQGLPHHTLQPQDQYWDHRSNLPWWIAEHSLPESLISTLHAAQKCWESFPSEEVKPPLFDSIAEALADKSVAALASCTLQQARETGIGQAGNSPHRHDLRPAPGEVSAAWPTLSGAGFSLGHLLVDGIVVKQWGANGLQLSLPCLYLDDVDLFLLGSSPVTDGEPMVRALVALSWAVRSSNGETGLQMVSAMHKAESEDFAGWTWWSRQCNSDREATLLTDSTITGPKATRTYAYLGGGSLSSASSHMLQCIVVRTRDWPSGAAVMAMPSAWEPLQFAGWAQGFHSCFFEAPLHKLENPARSLRASSLSAAPPGTMSTSTPTSSSLTHRTRQGRRLWTAT